MIHKLIVCSLFFLGLLSGGLFSTVSRADSGPAPISGEIYSQTISRPERVPDRIAGIFHETRLRASVGARIKSLEGSPISLSIDGGSYFLGEWGASASGGALPQNIVVSPFIGSRIQTRLNGKAWAITASFIFEGRLREQVYLPREATRAASGWDPRSSLVVGFWWIAQDPVIGLRPFLDVYGDAIYASRFSQDILTTMIIRPGFRYFYGEDSRLFFDGLTELFIQNAPAIDLGTKRSEMRIGFGTGYSLGEGSIQLRLMEGFPVETVLGRMENSRPRTEALLLLGVSI